MYYLGKTDSCSKQYVCVVILFAIISSFKFSDVMDCKIWAPEHENNMVDSVNTYEKHNLMIKCVWLVPLMQMVIIQE